MSHFLKDLQGEQFELGRTMLACLIGIGLLLTVLALSPSAHLVGAWIAVSGLFAALLHTSVRFYDLSVPDTARLTTAIVLAVFIAASARYVNAVNVIPANLSGLWIFALLGALLIGVVGMRENLGR